MGGRWLRRTSLDPYDPLTDDDAIALAFPNSQNPDRSVLTRRAWGALESLEEHGEPSHRTPSDTAPPERSLTSAAMAMAGGLDDGARVFR